MKLPRPVGHVIPARPGRHSGPDVIVHVRHVARRPVRSSATGSASRVAAAAITAASGGTAANPDVRASDEDRQRVVAELERHTAAGRLTLNEFTERAGRAYAAATHGDLAELTRDLPALPPPPPPAPVPARDQRNLLVALALALLTIAALALALAALR